jgi:hypothetical protein
MSGQDQEGKLRRYARELQEQVYRDILETYGPTAFDHLRNPRNFGLLDDPDGYARVKGTCGDTMEISVRMDGDRVAGCGFMTDGCGTTVVCGSVATEEPASGRGPGRGHLRRDPVGLGGAPRSGGPLRRARRRDASQGPGRLPLSERHSLEEDLPESLDSSMTQSRAHPAHYRKTWSRGPGSGRVVSWSSRA